MDHTERMEPIKANDASDFDTELSKTLSAALASRQQVSFSSRDEFSDWLRQGQEKRNRQRRRSLITGTAACAAVFACAFLVWSSGLISDVDGRALLPWNDAPTYASSETDSSITEESGSIVIGGDGNGNVGKLISTYTNYDELPEEYKQEIIHFEYIPEGYELYSIEIETDFGSQTISTTYINQDNVYLYSKQILVRSDDEMQSIINQCDGIITLANSDVYVKGNDFVKSYSLLIDNELLSIYADANIEQNKIEAMIASIKTDSNMS